MQTPTYKDAIDFYDLEKQWKNDDGTTRPWKYNHTLCNQARQYLGSYKLPKGVTGFRTDLGAATDFKGRLWGTSFHGLGDDEEEIFSFFTGVMNDTERFTTQDEEVSCMLDAWVKFFYEHCRVMGYKGYQKRTWEELAMAFYWAVANTVPGLVAEANAFRILEELFAGRDDIKIRWSEPTEDYADIDIVIIWNGQVWHKVSIKSGRAFSKDCIMHQYRGEFGKTQPTVYMDGTGNRIFVKEQKVWHAVVENGEEDHINRLIGDFVD